MTADRGRDTASTITDKRLDRLYARLDAAEAAVERARRAAAPLVGAAPPDLLPAVALGHVSPNTGRWVRFAAAVIDAVLDEPTDHDRGSQ